MELRILRYFLTVVQEGSMTKAAEKLHITQPTLSRQIAQMEEELGVKLFARGARKLALTSEGLLLRRRAEEILELVDKTETELVAQDAMVAGVVSVGCKKPECSGSLITVKDAIEDLPSLKNGAKQDILSYKTDAKSDYAKMLRKNMERCSGHLVSHNNNNIIKRYAFIPQGGNWKDIPDNLMRNYADKSRCHTGIYRRLTANQPCSGLSI